MSRRRSPLVLALALAVSSVPSPLHRVEAQGQTPAAPVALGVARYKPRVGERTRVVLRSTDARADETRRGESVVKTDKTSFVERIELDREVLAVDGGKITRERLFFKEFLIKHDRTEDRSLEGKSAIVDRGAGGASAFPEEASVVTGELARGWLDRWKAVDETEPHPFLPADKVAPGGTWRIDLDRAITLLGYGEASIDKGTSRATGTLKAIGKRGIETWAELVIEVELAMTALDKTSPEFAAPAKFRLTEKLELCLEDGRGDRKTSQEASFDGRQVVASKDPKPEEIHSSLRATREEQRQLLVSGRDSSPPPREGGK